MFQRINNSIVISLLIVAVLTTVIGCASTPTTHFHTIRGVQVDFTSTQEWQVSSHRNTALIFRRGSFNYRTNVTMGFNNTDSESLGVSISESRPPRLFSNDSFFELHIRGHESFVKRLRSSPEQYDVRFEEILMSEEIGEQCVVNEIRYIDKKPLLYTLNQGGISEKIYGDATNVVDRTLKCTHPYHPGLGIRIAYIARSVDIIDQHRFDANWNNMVSSVKPVRLDETFEAPIDLRNMYKPGRLLE